MIQKIHIIIFNHKICLKNIPSGIIKTILFYFINTNWSKLKVPNAVEYYILFIYFYLFMFLTQLFLYK